jgi:hypothetical protein
VSSRALDFFMVLHLLGMGASPWGSHSGRCSGCCKAGPVASLSRQKRPREATLRAHWSAITNAAVTPGRPVSAPGLKRSRRAVRIPERLETLAPRSTRRGCCGSLTTESLPGGRTYPSSWLPPSAATRTRGRVAVPHSQRSSTTNRMAPVLSPAVCASLGGGLAFNPTARAQPYFLSRFSNLSVTFFRFSLS